MGKNDYYFRRIDIFDNYYNLDLYLVINPEMVFQCRNLPKDPARGTPDGGELSEEGDLTEPQTPTSKHDRPENLESTEPIYKKETETYSATVTFSRSQCLAGKPLERN